jgi:hypothetical protein
MLRPSGTPPILSVRDRSILRMTPIGPIEFAREPSRRAHHDLANPCHTFQRGDARPAPPSRVRRRSPRCLRRPARPARGCPARIPGPRRRSHAQTFGRVPCGGNSGPVRVLSVNDSSGWVRTASRQGSRQASSALPPPCSDRARARAGGAGSRWRRVRWRARGTERTGSSARRELSPSSSCSAVTYGIAVRVSSARWTT